MRVRMWCVPLEESKFRNVILANYYQKMPGAPGQKLHFFRFELDHAQTRALMGMFSPSLSPINFWMPPVVAPGCEHVRESISSPVWAPKSERNNELKSEKVLVSYADTVNGNKFEGVGMGVVDDEHASLSKESSNGFDDLDCKETQPEWEDHALSSEEVEVQQPQQSDQQDKELSFKWTLEKLKALSAQQLNYDAYSGKGMQEVKGVILEGHSSLPENLDTEVDQLSWGHSNLLMQGLDSEFYSEAKVI